MRIGIYSPYLDTAGGGEKYILSIAEELSKNEIVDFLIGTHLYSNDIPSTIKRIELFHNLNLSKVNFIKAPIGMGSPPLKRLFFLKKYDILFYLTDGSIFFSTAKRNIIHFQVPFESSKGIWQKIKQSCWELAIYNSNFTKQIVEKNWHIKGKVIYPPVDTKGFKSLSKKNQIISVGRFFGYSQDKKHKILIEAFKKLVDEYKVKDWRLHLAGGVGEGDKKYFEKLKKAAKGYKIYFHPNISFSDLLILYGQSKIYWHAAGFGESDPKKFEHFGISTVEAMAAGCVPIVINKGGQREIVENEVNGFLWDSLDRMLELTKKVINDKGLFNKLADATKKTSRRFSKKIFIENIREIVYG